MKYQILQGDNRLTLKTLADNSIDAIVTDPPYGIDFLGKSWDANTGALETYQECLRVLKPGGHILAFSAARTYHHLAVTLEQAGFEIRDQIMWIQSSGFPKSRDLGQGWGTGLKPAHEPIALARKPIKTSIEQNQREWGVGGLRIDASRIPSEPRRVLAPKRGTYQCVEDSHSSTKSTAENMEWREYGDRFPSNVIGDIPLHQKYFYCPKVSKRERGEINNHPTVKPIELMKYLIKLITPSGGTVLDPFNGSGSTGCAAVELGHTYIGCELDPAYVEITKQRIEAWNKSENNFNELFE